MRRLRCWRQQNTSRQLCHFFKRSGVLYVHLTADSSALSQEQQPNSFVHTITGAATPWQRAHVTSRPSSTGCRASCGVRQSDAPALFTLARTDVVRVFHARWRALALLSARWSFRHHRRGPMLASETFAIHKVASHVASPLYDAIVPFRVGRQDVEPRQAVARIQ